VKPAANATSERKKAARHFTSPPPDLAG